MRGAWASGLLLAWFWGVGLPVTWGWAAGNDGYAQVHLAQEDRAQAALEKLRNAYAQRDLAGFFEGLGEDTYFNWLDFKHQLSRKFSDFSDIDLHIVVDHALSENDKVFLKTHWQKRMVNNRTGRSQRTNGEAQFIFKVNGTAKLVGIKGNSPF